MDGQEILSQSQLKPGRHTWLARVPFAFAAVVGGFVLFDLKGIGIDQLWVTGVAIVLIATYAIVVGLTPILRLREDQLADNCYYLGFLYTLFSLALALQTFAKAGDVAGIVANFGIALGSTIFGILLRVIINQARKDVIETEADARMELAQAVIRLRVEIDDAVLALSSFCKQTEQTASDAIRTTATKASGALEEGITRVGESAKTVLERIDGAFAEFTEHASQLNALSSGTVKALKGLLARIEKIEAPNDLIARRLDPVFGALETGVRELVSRIEKIETPDDLILKRFDSAFRLLDTSVDNLRERLEHGGSAIATATDRTADVTVRLTGAMEGMATAGNGIASISEASLRASQAAAQTAERLTALLALTERAVKEHERLSTQATAGTGQMGVALLQEQQHFTEGAKASLAALLDVFKSHNEAMALEVVRSQRMSAELGQALADLANSVTERVAATPHKANKPLVLNSVAP